jgi:hypothetical protein
MINYIFSWFILLAAAFTNAAIRELTYKKYIGDSANNASVFTGIILIGGCIWFISKRWGFASARQAWIVGIMWTVMTELFEFTMVSLSEGKGAEHFLKMHNIATGEMWPILIICILTAPYVCWRLQGQGGRASHND